MMISDQVHEIPAEEHVNMDPRESNVKKRSRDCTKKKENISEGRARKKMTKDERDHIMEEKKHKKLVSFYWMSNVIVFSIQIDYHMIDSLDTARQIAKSCTKS